MIYGKVYGQNMKQRSKKGYKKRKTFIEKLHFGYL